jgi:hypothetical protein
MRLAGAAVAESNNIVVGDDIFTTGQFESCLDVRGGEIGIVAEIEVCGSVFDLGDDELLDRIACRLGIGSGSCGTTSTQMAAPCIGFKHGAGETWRGDAAPVAAVV